MAYRVMAYIVMAYRVLASSKTGIGMAHAVGACIVMGLVVMEAFGREPAKLWDEAAHRKLWPMEVWSM